MRSGQAAFGRHQEPRPGDSVEADRRHARSSDARLLRRGSRAGVDNGRTGTAAAEGRRRDLADARLNPVGWCAAGVLTAADSLYLFCTWTSAFERFSRIWRFGFAKVLENIDFWADRLPPPPPTFLRESTVSGSISRRLHYFSTGHCGSWTVQQPNRRSACRRSLESTASENECFKNLSDGRPNFRRNNAVRCSDCLRHNQLFLRHPGRRVTSLRTTGGPGFGCVSDEALGGSGDDLAMSWMASWAISWPASVSHSDLTAHLGQPLVLPVIDGRDQHKLSRWQTPPGHPLLRRSLCAM